MNVSTSNHCGKK